MMGPKVLLQHYHKILAKSCPKSGTDQVSYIQSMKYHNVIKNTVVEYLTIWTNVCHLLRKIRS